MFELVAAATASETFWRTVGAGVVIAAIASLIAAGISARVSRKVAESTNKAHAEQIDKQLAHDRERLRADQIETHKRWVREQRHDSYTAFLARVNTAESFISHVQATGKAPDVDFAALLAALSSWGLWASQEVLDYVREHQDEVVKDFSEKARQYIKQKSPENAKALGESKAALRDYRAALIVRMRADLEQD